MNSSNALDHFSFRCPLPSTSCNTMLNQTPNGKGKGRMHDDLPRLPTSAAPNDAGYEADKTTRMAGASALAPSKETEAGQLKAQSKPIMGGFGEDEDSDDDDDDDFLSATEEQRAAVQRVLSKGDSDHHEVLGIEQGCCDAQILQGFAETGKDIHPYFNPDDGAIDAYRRVVKAAKALGVSASNIKGMKRYAERTDEYKTLHKGIWVDPRSEDL